MTGNRKWAKKPNDVNEAEWNSGAACIEKPELSGPDAEFGHGEMVKNKGFSMGSRQNAKNDENIQGRCRLWISHRKKYALRLPKPFTSGIRRLFGTFGISLMATVLPAAISLYGAPFETPAVSSGMPVAIAPELEVKPLCLLGTGKPNSSPDAISLPDGLAFTGQGLLIATDAANHCIRIFDPRAGKCLGAVGERAVIAGDLVNVVVLPGGEALSSDEVTNQVYRFEKDAVSAAGFRLNPNPLFKEENFLKLNGLAVDANGRIYAVDGARGEVRRYRSDFSRDPAWQFQNRRADNSAIIARSEGIAVDEKDRLLFLTDEWKGTIHAFDLETGRWTGKTIGRRLDASTGKPMGLSVFHPSVEGLAVLGDYLLAVDEGDDAHPGRLLIFDLRSPDLYETGSEACLGRMSTGRVSGLVGVLGHYCSPDGVAVFSGTSGMEAMVAVADQGNRRIVVYRWNDILAVLKRRK